MKKSEIVLYSLSELTVLSRVRNCSKKRMLLPFGENPMVSQMTIGKGSVEK